MELSNPSRVTISVYGLGKMGLPLAAVFADAGFTVIGVDIDQDVVDSVNAGISHVKNEPELGTLVKEGVEAGRLSATTDGPDAARRSDVMVILTPTLLTEERRADLSTVKAAASDISEGLNEGNLVILESTVPPGTTQKEIKPVLESGGATGFGLAYCPERTSSGRAIKDIRGAYPKVVGGVDRESGEAAEALYTVINSSGVIRVSDADTAEAVKVFEGVYRDVNIALANELAIIGSERGFDTLEAIEAANTQPFCDIHDPGCGVGGHCIPVYPYFLTEDAGDDARILRTARDVNEGMPERTVDILESGLSENGKSIEDARVLLLGLAFRGGVEETRFSPGVEIAERLKGRAADLAVNDPVLADVQERFEVRSVGLDDVDADNYDAIVVCTDHEEYTEVDWTLDDKTKKVIFVDGRNLYDVDRMTAEGFVYRDVTSGGLK